MKPQRIEKYAFSAKDDLLLDANIWLFLYCPHGDPHAHGPVMYSTAFKKIVSAKCKIYITSTVLGEFVNRYCRLAHRLLVARNAAAEEFKDFRGTVLFKPVAKAVADAGKRVLKDASPIGDDFASFDLGRILSDFERGRHDFNDLLIAEVCRRRKLTLITDDEDFSAQDVEILTANALLTD